MKLESEAIITKIKPFRDNSYIITCFSKEYGMLNGLSYINKRKFGTEVIKGSIANILWKARLPEHLGTLKIEIIKSNANIIDANQVILLIWSSVIELINRFLNEQEPHESLYNIIIDLNNHISTGQLEESFKSYIEFEIALLKEIGYGLDLLTCVKTGDKDNLHFVSPRSAKAVSIEAAVGYEDKLLSLPQFLVNGAVNPCKDSFNKALQLTGYFIIKYSQEFFNQSNFIMREQLINYYKNLNIF